MKSPFSHAGSTLFNLIFHLSIDETAFSSYSTRGLSGRFSMITGMFRLSPTDKALFTTGPEERKDTAPPVNN